MSIYAILIVLCFIELPLAIGTHSIFKLPSKMRTTLGDKKSNLRFILADDTKTFGELLKVELIRHFKPAELLNFSDGREALNACISNPPDLLITDLYLNNYDGRDLIRSLRSNNIFTRIIVLTAYPESNLPAQLVALGVAGFVDKNSPIEQINKAVNRVLDGGMFFSVGTPPPLPNISNEISLPTIDASVLSEREKEVVQMVTRGMHSKQIADKLNISIRTVEKHRSRILAKLSLHDIPTLVRWCLRNGLG